MLKSLRPLRHPGTPGPAVSKTNVTKLMSEGHLVVTVFSPLVTSLTSSGQLGQCPLTPSLVCEHPPEALCAIGKNDIPRQRRELLRLVLETADQLSRPMWRRWGSQLLTRGC